MVSNSCNLCILFPYFKLLPLLINIQFSTYSALAVILFSSPNSKNMLLFCFQMARAPDETSTRKASFMTSEWRSERNVKRVAYVDPSYSRDIALSLFDYRLRCVVPQMRAIWETFRSECCYK